MMNLNPVFAIVVFLIAYFTAYVFNLKYRLNNNLSSRYESVDGLRGFLAISVFIHHSYFWYQYIHSKGWYSESNFYSQLGSTAVSFFFMISSFLFISKLLNLKEIEFNWRAFFISRLFRLVPMYYFSLAIVVVIIMIITDWQLKVGVFKFLYEMFLLGSFAVIRKTSINDFSLTYLVNAGIVWSLSLEWLFYFSLPIISMFILKKKPSLFYLVISFLFVACYFYVNIFHIHYLLSFVGGAIAAVVLKYKLLTNKYETFFSFLILICLALILQFRNSNSVACKTLITIIFVLISSGNTLFGILKSSTLKLLGEISYSTYLLHGIVLFVVFYFGFGLDNAKNLTALEYCGVIFLITPIVVTLSFLCYRAVEKPFMEISKKYTK